MKRFYKENRVFVILMGIALVCIAIIIWMFAGYVINSTTNDKYGNRLDGISDVKINNNKIAEMESAILEMTKVQDVTINIHGKVINFNIDFDREASLEEMQNAAINCLEFFDEEYSNFYTLQFINTKMVEETVETEVDGEIVEDVQDKTYTILGYRKAGATTISWSNNAKN